MRLKIENYGLKKREAMHASFNPLVIIGVIAERTLQSVLLSNLKRLEGWDCIAMVLKKRVSVDSGLCRRCNIVYPPDHKKKWFWGGFLASVASSDVLKNNSHVMLLLDDVDLGSMDSRVMIKTLQREHAGVISPMITGATFKSMNNPEFENTVTTVEGVETYATVFTAEAFRCYVRMILETAQRFPLHSVVGWAYGRCYFAFCEELCGATLLDGTQRARHLGGRSLSAVHTTATRQKRDLEHSAKNLTRRECGRVRPVRILASSNNRRH